MTTADLMDLAKTMVRDFIDHTVHNLQTKDTEVLTAEEREALAHTLRTIERKFS